MQRVLSHLDGVRDEKVRSSTLEPDEAVIKVADLVAGDAWYAMLVDWDSKPS